MPYVGGADNTNGNAYTDQITYDQNGNAYTDGSMQTPVNGGSSSVAPPAGYTPSQSGVGGFLQGVGQTITGSNNNFTNASFVPAMLTAGQLYNDAGKYQDLGNQAADRADPFGPQRAGYIARLNQLYADPSSIANTPGYKFALNQALDATQGRLAAQGFGGTGTMADSLSAQASGLAQQTFNQERNALMQMSGVQFNPAQAAQMQMEGGQLGLQAKENALGAMMYPFGPGAAGNTVNVNGGSNGQGGSSAMNPYSAGQAATSAIMQGGQAGFQAAGNLLNQGIRFVKLPDGTVADLQQYEMHGADNGSGDTTPYYPTQSAVDSGATDPNSQFWTGGDYTNLDPNAGGASDVINGAVPIDDNNPFAGFDFSDWSGG